MNSNFYWYLFFALSALVSCTNHTNKYFDNTTKASYELIERVTPGYSNQFAIEISSERANSDFFEISGKDGMIHLKGNNTISIASAFHWYLKYECNAHLSWNGDQMNLPEVLPVPQNVTHKTIDAKHRVYMNYCTFNYSASWWNWERWQREIDYMAMNGINMPLSVVGLEGTWYHTLLKFGFTDLEAREFLVGPAFFAWQWMANIQSHEGPLPKNWIDDHIELGKKIIDRQLELGMQPIQEGFSGYVPRKMKQKFPNAAIQIEEGWCGFSGTAQLDPLDPLFKEFGITFLETQKELFGAHGLYAADPFHEGKPPLESTEYLKKVGEAINNLFSEFDSSSVWAMQSWSIREDIAKAVPKEKLLILDLAGWKWHELDDWGYDFVVGYLHNFGGRNNLHGDLKHVAGNQFYKARQKAPNAVGSGLFMEGIAQNPIFYDLAFEMTFHQEEINLNEWIEKYALRRYSASSVNANNALLMLKENPYKEGTNHLEFSSMIAARPTINVKKSGPNNGFKIPYDSTQLIKALDILLLDAEKLKSSDAYRFDVVDVQRQILSNLSQEIQRRSSKAFIERDLEAFKKHSAQFIELLDDLDLLLRTRPELLLDTWIADARKWGATEEEKKLYEKNASMLVTQWGGDVKMMIYDYSWREWSGLIKGYYKPRWQKWFALLQKHLEEGTSYSEEGLPQEYQREALRANNFYSELADWETQWIESEKILNTNTHGDEIEKVLEIREKYKPIIEYYYSKK